MSRLLFSIVILLSLVATSHAQSDFGSEAYKQGRYTAAYGFWKPLADAGNTNAQFNLGLLYEFGLGVERELSEAARWYLTAANAGMARAQARIGDFYVRGQFSGGVNYPEAAKWFKRAAESGHVGAQRNLGVLLATGQGVSKDEKAAIVWLKKAQKKGDSSAQEWLQFLQNRDSQAQTDNAPAAVLKAAVKAYLTGDYALAALQLQPLAEQDLPQAQLWLELAQRALKKGAPVEPTISRACAAYFIARDRAYAVDQECGEVTSEACVDFLVGENRGHDIGSVCKNVQSEACVRFLVSANRGHEIDAQCVGVESDDCVQFVASQGQGFDFPSLCQGVTSAACVNYFASQNKGHEIGSQCKDIGSDKCVEYLVSQDRGYEIGSLCKNVTSNVCVEHLIEKNRWYDIGSECRNIASEECVKIIIKNGNWEDVQDFCAI